jgi:hypothetical protein
VTSLRCKKKERGVDEETNTKQYETVILPSSPSFLLFLPLLQAKGTITENIMLLLPGYFTNIYYIGSTH